MKEKNIFLLGLGTGLVITSIISLFSYNMLKHNNVNINEQTITTITTITSDTSNEPTSNITETSLTTTINETLTSTQTTTKKIIEMSYKPNLEISTTKPFELSTN